MFVWVIHHAALEIDKGISQVLIKSGAAVSDAVEKGFGLPPPFEKMKFFSV